MHEPFATATAHCRVCGSVGPARPYVLREMMFGTREAFDYFECGACGCLQIAEVPGDLARHYPSNYYAQVGQPQKGSHGAVRMRRWMQRQVVRPALFGWGYRLGRMLRPPSGLPDAFHRARPEILRRARLSGFDAPILDVGCGDAALWLRDLQAIGFTRLSGVDPFLRQECSVGGLTLMRGELGELAERQPGRYELVAFNHSLEHIPEQRQAIAAASRLLRAGGTCVVRIPVLPNGAWEEYGENWVELDAPRHLYIHTRASLERLAAAAGLRVSAVWHDTTAFEFYGSEQYRNGVSLVDPRSAWVNKASPLFSAERLRDFEQRAEVANRTGTAGRAVFELRRESDR